MSQNLDFRVSKSRLWNRIHLFVNRKIEIERERERDTTSLCLQLVLKREESGDYGKVERKERGGEVDRSRGRDDAICPWKQIKKGNRYPP